MAIYEFIVGIFSAIVGRITEGIVKHLLGHKPKTTNVTVTHTSQVVLVVAPSTLLAYKFPLTDRTRDILQIPKNHGEVSPKLIIPTQGLVSRSQFIDCSMDTLIIQAAEPVRCFSCGQARRWGAFLNNNWYCTDHVHPHITQMVDKGKKTLELVPQNDGSWGQIESLLREGEGSKMIRDDVTIQALISGASETGIICGSDAHTSGHFYEFWIDHGREHFGEPCMEIWFSCRIEGWLNNTVCAVALFHSSENGGALVDFDNAYRTENGFVCVNTGDIVLESNVVSFCDWSLIMPYSQLHLARGYHLLKCQVGIYSRSAQKYILYSEWQAFNVNQL